jgi:hypothetical protein
MDDLDFDGWKNADWHGVFAHLHTDDVYVEFKGMEPTRGLDQHIDAMKAYVESVGGTPPQVVAHPIAFGSGEWTCVVGESPTAAAWSRSPSGATARSPRSTSGLDGLC